MNKFFVNLLALGIAVVLVLSTGCNDGDGNEPPTPPPPVTGTFSTGVSTYICGTGSPAAFAVNTNDVALLSVDVTGDVAPQFKHMEVHEWFSNSIDCGGGPNCCVFANFPESGGYRVTLFFNEKGTDNCPPPNPGQCYRWMFTDSFLDGFVPSCSENEVFIATPNPDGFEGPCS